MPKPADDTFDGRYAQFVKYGVITAIMRDAVLMAVNVQHDFCDIASAFANAGVDERSDQIEFTKRLVHELLSTNLVAIGSWDPDEKGFYKYLALPSQQVDEVIDAHFELLKKSRIQHFLLPTRAANKWAERYWALIKELDNRYSLATEQCQIPPLHWPPQETDAD